jgi:hypothetical protein
MKGSGPEQYPRALNDSRLPASLPIFVLLAAMAVLWAADLRTSHESPFLLIALNLVFATLVSLFIAYLVGRSFLVRGAPGLLMLGCGVLIWGASGLVGAVVGDGNPHTTITPTPW